MRNIVVVAFLVGLGPWLLAEENRKLSTEESTRSTVAFTKVVQSVPWLSLEDLLVTAEFQQTQPILQQYPAPPVLYASQKTEGLIIASIGGGLAALGISLAATAGETGQATVTVTDPFFGSSTTTVETSTVNNGKRWSGVGLAAAGGVLVWYGLSKRK